MRSDHLRAEVSELLREMRCKDVKDDDDDTRQVRRLEAAILAQHNHLIRSTSTSINTLAAGRSAGPFDIEYLTLPSATFPLSTQPIRREHDTENCLWRVALGLPRRRRVHHRFHRPS